MKEKEKRILAITACPTGVAHTYIAQEKLEVASTKLGHEIKIETHGSIGIKNNFSQAEIIQADLIIISVIGGTGQLDMERFNNKLVYYANIKDVIKNAENVIEQAFKEAKIQKAKSKKNDDLKIKENKSFVSHLMSGISFMIPFIVFAGITSALIAGITNAMGVELNKDATGGLKFMWILNEFANIGFSVMMGFAGAYIANSIAGRAAIAPAFLLTMLGNRPDLWWQDYFKNIIVNGKPITDAMQPLNIVGALIFGLLVGYSVKWINTKWKINKYIQPIMPIIIIPVFLTLFFGIIWIFTIGPLLGIAVGYLYSGILIVERSGVGMALVGLVLGLLAGVDMGGPINKIASFGATAMIIQDHGSAMGTAAAAFAIAPLGCGLTSLIFKNKFKDDREMAINASILGFMGVSESAIPFAIKYRWAVIVPNIICSGIAGMFAGLFAVQGHVGAWGGPIIAIFAGVTTTSGSFIGILWYFLAIAIGTALHIILFRILVEVQTKGTLTKQDFKNIFSTKKNLVQRKRQQQ